MASPFESRFFSRFFLLALREFSLHLFPLACALGLAAGFSVNLLFDNTCARWEGRRGGGGGLCRWL